MEATLPANVTNHYRRNSDSYDKISARLSATRSRFLEASKTEQVTMLQKSHSWAVISVQTPVDIHENAFTELWQTDDMSESNILDALKSVNYKYNKATYIQHSLDNPQLWIDVADMLEKGQIDKAHKFTLDKMKGVGPAKAPFVLAMLGFEEKMCIDTNIVSAFDLDGHPTTVVVEKYERITQKIRDKMPTMRDLTSPFLFQWAVFDYQRGDISMHDTFYEVL